MVGAIMRPSLPDVSGLPEVNYLTSSKPWFSYVPKKGRIDSSRSWFGARLVEMIQARKARQEIGFHSFSHVPFGWPGMTRERASAEYRYCAQDRAKFGTQPSVSFFRESVAYTR